MNVENPAPENSKTTRHIIWGFLGLLCGVLLGIFISIIRNSADSRINYTVESDNNLDGKPDATYHYQEGVVVRMEIDRNFDGKSDYIEWYERGIVSRGELDDDFDGKIDGWVTFRNSNLGASQHDTDKNGVPDLFLHFEHGVLKIASWRPNKSKNPTRIQVFESNFKAKEFRDTTGDGMLDTVAMFDPFENQIKEEKLNEPLSAEDAIIGILNNR